MERVSIRCHTALKRLAVYHDGGQSVWLDDPSNQTALSELLERLSGPAEEPFPRQAVLPAEAVAVLPEIFRYADDALQTIRLDFNEVAPRLCSPASRRGRVRWPLWSQNRFSRRQTRDSVYSEAFNERGKTAKSWIHKPNEADFARGTQDFVRPASTFCLRLPSAQRLLRAKPEPCF
jgi:hypothetical protein